VVVLQMLAEEFNRNPNILAGTREFMAGGEQLQITGQISDLFSQLDSCQLFNHYGPSETHVVTSLLLPGRAGDWPALPPLGRPIINTEIYVLDRYLQPVPVGIPGELYIGGACLAHGYLKRPGLTAERFIPNSFSDKPGSRMYKTGDVTRYLADGNLEFLGRNDFQVKIRGMRVEMGEIEVELKRHPAIREAAVIFAKDNQDCRLIAYLVFHPGQAVDSRQVRAFLRERLPEYMLPSVITFLNEFPITPSGKIDRRALPVPEKDPDSSEGYVAPRTDLEAVLAGIFSDVLQVERIGVLDDFFELGGHSLLATQISSRVRELLHTELPVRKIFEEPTVSGLARIMMNDETEPGRIERNAELLLKLCAAPEDEESMPTQG
jgi:acyl-coenzyme A synthetase/AMP-(fatty) acid ligase